MSEGYFQRREQFDVILVKNEVNALGAKPEDFKRVGVTATESALAGDEDEVKKAIAEGYRQVEIVGGGRPSDYETMARHRATSGDQQ